MIALRLQSPTLRPMPRTQNQSTSPNRIFHRWKNSSRTWRKSGKAGCLTNNGPFHQQLEQALCDYLGVKYISLFCNGTIALVTALKALRIGGEVITTPYSFVATAHALRWNNITPVFVDIDPNTMNLDPARIESAITPETTAILPVHCYGNPCDVDAIEEIAANYNLKVIYDAAHAFRRQLPLRQRLESWRSVRPELPRHQGLQYVRGRRNRLSGRAHQAPYRPSEKFRFRQRNHRGRYWHQRKNE